MTRARDIANLVDANGDIVAGALDNVPAADLVNDTTPQLGGALDAQDNNITSVNDFYLSASGYSDWKLTNYNGGFYVNNGTDRMTVDATGNVIIQGGSITNSGNVYGHSYHPINRTSVLSQVAQFSITAETTGNIDVVNTYGYPSGVKAIFCSVWVQQDGYTSSNGADHASYHFGQAIPDGEYASTGNISTAFDSPFSFHHDGEGASTGDHGEYGLYTNGLIPVNSNGRIYYRLGHGYSGGTHYISLIMNGYII